MKYVQIIATILVLITIAGFFGWRYQLGKKAKHNTNHAVILIDRSTSTANICSSLLGLAKQVLESKDFKRGSTLTVLATGDKSSADEPGLVFQTGIPHSTRVMENKHAQEKQREDLLFNLQGKCKSIEGALVSPIYLGVQRSVEHLRGLGCHPKSHCLMFVQTDGLETQEKEFGKRLIRKQKSKSTLSIDNSGIRITFCGLSETQGRKKPHTAQNAEAINAAWKSFFTEPEQVVLQPFCPKYHLKEKE